MYFWFWNTLKIKVKGLFHLKQDRFRSGVAKLVLEIAQVKSLVYFVFLKFFYFFLFNFLAVLLLNYSIIHLSSFFIMNCGKRTNRKWNYKEVSVLPFFFTWYLEKFNHTETITISLNNFYICASSSKTLEPSIKLVASLL